MELLKLLLVDDEKIILKGLCETYDWESMGYQVVGAAQSGEEALALMEDEEPDVVITDVRMKKVSGLALIEQSRLVRPHTKFVVLSAYKDFEYAKKACEEGALAYLVKPASDEELAAVMQKAYGLCIGERKKEREYESFKKILGEDQKAFLSQMIERFVKDIISEQELLLLTDRLASDVGIRQYFCSICVDIDVIYKITNQIDFEAKRYLLLGSIEKQIQEAYEMWSYRGDDGNGIFIVKLGEHPDTAPLQAMLADRKREYEDTVVSSISNAYVGLGGLKTAYRQGIKLYEIACEAGAGVLAVPKGYGFLEAGSESNVYFEDMENQVIRVLRKSSAEQLKEVFEQLVYHLPSDEATAKAYLHRLAVRAEVMLDDSYEVSENIRLGFANFYGMLDQYTLVRLIGLLYKLLGAVVEERLLSAPAMAKEYFSEYMESALTYVRGHLHEEELSITTVAESVFLNPVYFGRLFKNVMGMTFKKYVLNERMERAKRLLLETRDSISEIAVKVGIGNPSYFSQLFKQATGKLPSEYKKEYHQ